MNAESAVTVPYWGACDFLRRKFTSLNFPLVLLALIGQSDFYFQKVTRTRL
jgi:hypothetical protein